MHWRNGVERFHLLHWLVVACCWLLLSTGCGGVQHPNLVETMGMLPITDRPTAVSKPGSFVWHELLTTDMRTSGLFYEQLFGWDIEYTQHYGIARNRGMVVAGIIERKKVAAGNTGAWIPYISVADLDESLLAVRLKGGAIVTGPLQMGVRGRVALVKDAQHAHAVLIKSPGGDPSEIEPASGDWLWDEIWTTDPQGTYDFYREVVGFEQIVPIDSSYSVFLKSDEWLAGVRHLQHYAKPQLWVPVIRVEDTERTMQRVVELGGKVLVTPDMIAEDRDVALIRDTAGALLMVQSWRPEIEGGDM